jgi:nicotinamidase-related amidase
MRSALLVIDVQQAITKQKSDHIRNTLHHINQIIQSFPIDQVYYVRHIEENTEFDESNEDSNLSDELLLVNDQIIKKHYNSAFLKTDLDEQLRMKGIDNIYICGFQTEYCIDATIKTGHFLGYHVHVYKDGHHTFDREIPAINLKEHYDLQFQIYAHVIDHI